MRNINVLYRECNEKLCSLGIRTGKVDRLTVNTRAKSRAGRARMTACYNPWDISRPIEPHFEIEIAESVLDEEKCSEEASEEVMMHEILHTAKDCQNHGRLWKSYAQRANIAFGLNIKRTIECERVGLEPPEKRPVKYIFRCCGCGEEIRRVKESSFTRNPGNYRCSRCGGRFRQIF